MEADAQLGCGVVAIKLPSRYTLILGTITTTAQCWYEIEPIFADSLRRKSTTQCSITDYGDNRREQTPRRVYWRGHGVVKSSRGGLRHGKKQSSNGRLSPKSNMFGIQQNHLLSVCRQTVIFHCQILVLRLLIDTLPPLVIV